MTTLSRFLQSSMDRANADIASGVLRSRGPIVQVAVHGPNGVYEGDGLIDTGADHTTIDERVFQKIGLKPVGTSLGQGVTSGKMVLPLYKVRLTFPGTKFPAANFEKIPSVPNLLDIGLVALIGRDVLANSNLLYRGSDGFFAMAPVSDGDKIAVLLPLLPRWASESSVFSGSRRGDWPAQAFACGTATASRTRTTIPSTGRTTGRRSGSNHRPSSSSLARRSSKTTMTEATATATTVVITEAAETTDGHHDFIPREQSPRPSRRACEGR